MKPVLWIASSKKDLTTMPEKVMTDLGYALYEAQRGEFPGIAKPLKGFGGAEVLELVSNHRSDTFRAVYTVRFADAIVVLHVFQKKSKSGISTPKKEIDLIRRRLKRAEELYKEWKRHKR